MRRIEYRHLPPVGPGSCDTVTGSLFDLVLDIPYFLAYALIPPIPVMNAEFRSEGRDAAMSGGCAWDPFEITEPEYEELVRELQNRGFRRVAVPEWVRNKTDWHIWTSEHEIGIPAEEHYRLWREEDAWQALKKQAQKDGDEEKALQCHLKGIEAGKRLVEFLDPYLKKYHKTKNR